MTIDVTDYIDVRQRLKALGCHDPIGFVLLPTNFEAANSISEFRQVAEGATVKTLLRSANLPHSDVFPAEQRPPYVQNNDFEWVAPILFVSAALMSGNPDCITTVLDLLANYLADFFRGLKGEKKVTLVVVVEGAGGKTCKKVSYDGPVEGLREISDIVRTLKDE